MLNHTVLNAANIYVKSTRYLKLKSPSYWYIFLFFI